MIKDEKQQKAYNRDSITNNERQGKKKKRKEKENRKTEKKTPLNNINTKKHTDFELKSHRAPCNENWGGGGPSFLNPHSVKMRGKNLGRRN